MTYIRGLLASVWAWFMGLGTRGKVLVVLLSVLGLVVLVIAGFKGYDLWHFGDIDQRFAQELGKPLPSAHGVETGYGGAFDKAWPMPWYMKLWHNFHAGVVGGAITLLLVVRFLGSLAIPGNSKYEQVFLSILCGLLTVVYLVVFGWTSLPFLVGIVLTLWNVWGLLWKKYRGKATAAATGTP